MFAFVSNLIQAVTQVPHSNSIQKFNDIYSLLIVVYQSTSVALLLTW